MPWLEELLARNAHCAYLRRYGSPRTVDEFIERVPIVSHDDIEPFIASPEPDVLFAGRPVAYERTSGSSGASKLIPYSAEGLGDFRRAVAPWVSRMLRGVTGSVYLAISPATRAPEFINGIPVGLPDCAYVDLDIRPAVPYEVASIADVEQWRAETVRHLAAARDLEVISVWSPTFLLRLLDEYPFDWPALRIVSCWASSTSKPFAEELARRLPQARIQPKGLISTECVVTVPDEDDRPRLNPSGFFEFERVEDDVYEVIATTASGLYRYRTGDLVNAQLEFLGRARVSDLVGEKLSEPFVASCLHDVRGFLAPQTDAYVLFAEHVVDAGKIESRLCANPQYAYARRLGQLQPLRVVHVLDLQAHYTQTQLARGARLGDIKPPGLMT